MTGTEYHWLVTLQWTDARGITKAQTGAGTITAGEGATRQGLTLDVLKYAREQVGALADAAVLCFVLEPNALKQPKQNKGQTGR
ncbi:hypothetical protein ACIQNU_04565 [Streptomyces sp. NPDC091292]|uniref:hypothetical protein n=1 Tax=Streptomyces sp. NPDC091292 TaxID=3365991 RepID=UPI003821EE41